MNRPDTTSRNIAIYEACIVDGVPYSDMAKAYGRCAQTIKNICVKQARLQALIPPERWTLDTEIADTTLSFRLRNIFEPHKTTFREVLDTDQWHTRLFCLPNLGRKSHQELVDAMDAKGWLTEGSLTPAPKAWT